MNQIPAVLHKGPTGGTCLPAGRAHGATCAPGAERILAAYHDALYAAETATQKALFCGQLLREQRQAMMTCHDGKSSQWNDRTKPKDDQFAHWLKQHCPQIAQRTAYRWMAAAERVQHVLKLDQVIDVEGVVLSEVIQGAGGEGRGAEGEGWGAEEGSAGQRHGSTLKARQLWLEFTADKTLTQCLSAVLYGDAPDHRLARAYHGRHAPGAGGSGDRKAWEKFAALALRTFTRHVNQNLQINQKGQIVAGLERSLEHWPRWALETVADKCRRELKLSEEQRAGRGEL